MDAKKEVLAGIVSSSEQQLMPRWWREFIGKNDVANDVEVFVVIDRRLNVEFSKFSRRKPLGYFLTVVRSQPERIDARLSGVRASHWEGAIGPIGHVLAIADYCDRTSSIADEQRPFDGFPIVPGRRLIMVAALSGNCSRGNFQFWRMAENKLRLINFIGDRESAISLAKRTPLQEGDSYAYGGGKENSIGSKYKRIAAGLLFFCGGAFLGFLGVIRVYHPYERCDRQAHNGVN